MKKVTSSNYLRISTEKSAEDLFVNSISARDYPFVFIRLDEDSIGELEALYLMYRMSKGRSKRMLNMTFNAGERDKNNFIIPFAVVPNINMLDKTNNIFFEDEEPVIYVDEFPLGLENYNESNGAILSRDNEIKILVDTALVIGSDELGGFEFFFTFDNDNDDNVDLSFQTVIIPFDIILSHLRLG